MDGIFGNKIIICCCHHIINFDQYSSHGNNKSDCNKSAILVRGSMNISLACNLFGESNWGTHVSTIDRKKSLLVG